MIEKSKRSTKRPTPVRRTNVERSATTRSKLIEAAIELLHKEGYSETTTISVAAKARVSRGAMLHQFPTRTELLLAVAEHIVEVHRKYRVESLAREKFPSGIARLTAATDVSWAIQSQPSAIALLEIMMATRSDKELRKGFAPFTRNWADLRKQAATRLAADLGIPDVGKLEDYVTLHQTSLRGLAIELIFANDPGDVERARRLLAQYERAFINHLMAKAKTKP
jgi:AcrR family transcriptional regulator